MGELLSMDDSEEMILRDESALVKLTEDIFLDTNASISRENTISMPIAQLSSLGAGVSSLLPAFRTVTQTATVNTQGLYTLANAAVGDTLKVAKNGNYWAALKTADGASKFAQLQDAGALSATTRTVTSINPATMMMAVALFSIEQQLGSIAEMERQILSFLEQEKQSEIEADVQTLGNILAQYKFNWDNERYIADNHKLVLDIQRTARKHMLSFQKNVSGAIDVKNPLVTQKKVDSVKEGLLKRFKYYRMSLFTYAMASLVEVMLGGNFREEYITEVRSEIDSRSMEYREVFSKCSAYLERLSGSSVEVNVLKGIGTAGNAVGKFIGKIPVVEKGPVDELLQDGGARLKSNAAGIETETISSFAAISNPGTGVIIAKMDDMVRIYNHTSKICFDDKNIYLIAG